VGTLVSGARVQLISACARACVLSRRLTSCGPAPHQAHTQSFDRTCKRGSASRGLSKGGEEALYAGATHPSHQQILCSDQALRLAQTTTPPALLVATIAHPSLAKIRGMSGSVASATTKVWRRPARTFVSWLAALGT